MAIVPYSNNVEINFEKTNMENFLSVISFLCLVMSIYLILFRIKKHV
jgi:hypothetical protein